MKTNNTKKRFILSLFGFFGFLFTVALIILSIFMFINSVQEKDYDIAFGVTVFFILFSYQVYKGYQLHSLHIKYALSKSLKKLKRK